MDILPIIIGAISASIFVPLFMWSMKKIDSLRHAPASHKTFEQLKLEYSKWELFGSLFFILFCVIIGFSTWGVLQYLYTVTISKFEPSIFLITQPTVSWALPSIFLAIFISAIPMHFLLLWLLGEERYSEYTEYGNQKFQVNSWKLVRYMAYIMVPICILFTTMAFNNYVRVNNEYFIVNEFFSFSEKKYKFDEVKNIELVKSFKAPNGDVVRNPYYVIYFNDDNYYNFHKTLQDLDLSQQKDICDYLVEQIGLDIKIIDPYKT